MNSLLKSIGLISLTCVNLIWKLGLGVIGVAAIFLIIFLSTELNSSEQSKGKKINNYLKELEKDGYVSLYNQRDQKFTLEKLDWVSHCNEDDNIAVYCKNGKRGFYDYNTGKPLTKPLYNRAWNFHESIGAVEMDGYVFFVNADFQQALPQKYKIIRASDAWPEAIRFVQGQCKLALTSDSIGVIDKIGNWILEPKYQFVSDLSSDSCRIVKINGLSGVVNYNGRVLIEPVYDAVRLTKPGIANIVKDGYQKQITYSGKVLRDFVFDDIIDFEYPASGEFTLFEVNNKFGVMRTHNCEIIIPALYDELKYLSGNRFKAKLPYTENISSQQSPQTSVWIILDEHNNVLSDKR